LNAGALKKATFKANISLVSPQNYVMYDTVILFHKPLKPRILYARRGIKSANAQPVTQVRFEKDGSAIGYKVRYRTNDVTKETPVTTNNYINIIDIDAGQLTNTELIAINNVGETARPFSVAGNEKELMAPLIRYTEATDGGFFLEMETMPDDRRYIVQTSDCSGDYNKAATTVAETKGALKVSGLINGKTYYYRLKRSDGQGESDWSEEGAVKPDGGLRPVNPYIRGVISNGSEAIVCFEPVKKTTGYDMLYRYGNEKNWHHEVITATQIDQYQFKFTGTGKIEVKLASVNQYGRSDYSTFSL